MTVTMTIENTNNDFLNAIKAMAKATGAIIKTQKMIEAQPSKKLLVAIQEAEEISKNPQNYKTYSNAKKMMEDCLND